MRIDKFEDLKIWKLSLKLTKDIYDITSIGRFSKDFGLRDQIRKAMISVSSNIVEGFEKNNNNELIRFLRISKGSIGEIRNQLYIALAIDYITPEQFKKLNQEFVGLSNQVGKFISYLETQKRKTR